MWHCLFVKKNVEAVVVSNQLQEEHFVLLAATGNMDAVIFSRYDSETTGTYFYFSPGTETLASVHGATRCEKPLRSEAGGILIGDQTASSRIFS
jgi:hypothetical protein